MLLPSTSLPNDGRWDYRTHSSSNQVPDVSLIFIVDAKSPRVLLGLKKRGFGQGLYNGFGGKPEPGEDMIRCAQRELEEESGIVCQITELRHRGTIVIARPCIEADCICIAIQVYTLLISDAASAETEEMSPRWFQICEGIPFGQMWPEARLYLPGLLEVTRQDSHVTLQAYIEYRWLRDDDPQDSWRSIIATGQKEYLAGWSINWSGQGISHAF